MIALRAAFASVESAAKQIVAPNMGVLYADKPPLMRVISALADGADRLGAAAAPDTWELSAVLPMSRKDYLADFDPASATAFEALLQRAATVTELSPPVGADIAVPEARTQQYRRLALFLARQADVLFAVWDGKAAAGPGGTAEVVAEALGLGVPVLWIDSITAKAEWLTLLQPDGSASRGSTSVNGDAVQALGSLLKAPTAASGLEHGAGAPKPDTPAYLSRPWPRALRRPFAYQALRAISGADLWRWPLVYDSFDAKVKEWTHYCELAPPTATAPELRSRLAPMSVWADAMAWTYGHTFRSAYVTIFALAGLAPAIGLLYLYRDHDEHVLHIKAGFVLLELLIILAIVILVGRGVRRHWHGLWIQTRELAELLRQGRGLAYVGALRSFMTSARSGGDRDLAIYLTRACFRQIGPPAGTLDDAYFRQALAAFRDAELKDQETYHAGNAKRLRHIHHFLHQWGERCFYAAGALLCLYLIVWFLDTWVLTGSGEAGGPLHKFLEDLLKPTVSTFAAGLPAIGAAFAGINAQGDFSGFAGRSRAMAETLTDLIARFDARLGSPRPIDFDEASQLTLQAVETMASEVGAWRQTYVAKRLTLPA